MSKPKLPKTEFDAPWKQILDIYFEHFIAYCWSDKYDEIDWKKGYKPLDKELNKIVRNAPVGGRIVDKLIEVYRKNGAEAYMLIHLEVQGNQDPNFEERMFVYRYRLRDLYKKPIASLAILIDRDSQWRPGIFREELWGSSIEMKFPIIKLIDYKNRVEELEASTNLFATVILAQLAALEKQSLDDKLISKINLIKWLYNRGRKKEDIITLLIFIDWVIALPTPLEVKCREVISTLEEELHVNYITSFERIATQKGLEQGVKKGESAVLLRLLKHKFKTTIPENYHQQINNANADELLILAERVLESNTLEGVFRA